MSLTYSIAGAYDVQRTYYYSSWAKAKQACEAEKGSGECGYGGGFAYYSWFVRYVPTPNFTIPRRQGRFGLFLSQCYSNEHIVPFEGAQKGDAGVPEPYCSAVQADLVPVLEIDSATEQELTVGAEILLSTLEVANGGAGAMNATTTARLAISTDILLDSSDVSIESFSTPALAGNSSEVIDLDKVTIPELAPGDYYLLFDVNVSEVEGEEDYDNNLASWPFEVLKKVPDLVLEMDTDAEVLPPSGDFEVDLELTNAGNGDYPITAPVGVFLSKDTSLSEDDHPLKPVVHVPALAAGDTFTELVVSSIPDTTLAGDYYLIGAAAPAVVLGQASLPDEDDLDNNVAQPKKITIESPKIEIEICVGNPISTNSGRKIETEVDYRGSGPFPLEFARYYNSRQGNTKGWSTSYSRHLLIDEVSATSTNVILVLDDTMRYEFKDIEQRGYSDPDIPGLLTETESGFAYLDDQGSMHQFNHQGQLTSVTNQTGFNQYLVYEGEHLSSVTDHFGRSLTLNHDSDGNLTVMQTPAGERFEYRYNEDGLLAETQLPDETPLDSFDNPTRQYLYESANLAHGLTGIIDENGNRYSTFDYDAQGRAVLSTHFGSTDQNLISYLDGETRVTNALGKDTVYVFDKILGTNRLARVEGEATVNCAATQMVNQYDSRGSVTQTVDPKGNVTQNTYTHSGLADDEYSYHVGLLTRRTEAAGTAEARITTIQWHEEYRLPTQIVEDGRTIDLTYDDSARLIERREVGDNQSLPRVWRYTYDTNGLLTGIDGPRTDVIDVTTFAYNGSGDLIRVTNALGQSTEILAYDLDGLPIQVQDPNGLLTQLSYDAQNRLQAVAVESDAGVTSTSINYDAKGNVISITLPDGQTLSYQYDLADRLIQISNQLGETIQFELDDAGNRISESTHGGDGSLVRVQRRAFDELSRLISTIGAADQTTQLQYDRNDNLSTIEDALGRQTQLDFDGLNRLIQMTDALQGETHFTYDARDNLTSVTDAEGVVTEYIYDGLNNLLQEISTASGTTTHGYDAAGNRINTVDANGVLMNYEYDALNRMTAQTFAEQTEENIQYRYDEGANGIGRLTSLEDASGSTEFGYDQRGNLIRDARVIGDVTYVTHYQYNLANQLIAMTYPSGRIVHYQLDALSRVIAVTTQQTSASPIQSVAADFEYLPFGPAQGWQHGNGLDTDIAYDQDYRVTQIDVNGEATQVMALQYTYNDVSNITAMLDNLGLQSQTFEYDALNRLTAANGQYGDMSYGYDGVGNRTQRTVTTAEAETSEQYTYEPGSHRLTSVETSETTMDGTTTRSRTLNHDANGNTIADTTSDNALALGVNARNRLSTLHKNGKQVGEYQYNALGQRVSKVAKVFNEKRHTHSVKSSKHSKQSNKRHGKSEKSHKSVKLQTERIKLHFHYDQQGNLIAESKQNGKAVREYIYLGGYRIAMLAEQTAFARPKDHSNKSDKRSNKHSKKQKHKQYKSMKHGKNQLALYYIHNDHLGTPNQVTDVNQNTVWTMKQTPFGELIAANDNSFTMPMRFPGQYADAESGLSYNYFRDYDPSLGRYVQSDPIGLRGGVGVYGYSALNPLSFIDLDGRAANLGLAVFGGILGAVAGAVSAISNGNDASATDISIAAALGFAGGFIGGLTFGAIPAAPASILLSEQALAAVTGALASATGELLGQLVTQGLDGVNLDKVGMAGIVGSASGMLINLARLMRIAPKTAIGAGASLEFLLSPAVARADIKSSRYVDCSK